MSDTCPTAVIFLDTYAPLNSRYIDIGAGGPSPFTFTATSNVSWLTLTPSEGTVSPSSPEMRVEATVDWSRVNGSQTGQMNFSATAEGQPEMKVPVFFVANRTTAPEDYKGKLVAVLNTSDSDRLALFHRFRGGRRRRLYRGISCVTKHKRSKYYLG